MDIFIYLPNNEFLRVILNISSNPKSLIIFAHWSGSSASSLRNKYVSDVLNDNGYATLLFDLLTPQEQESDIKSQKIMGKFPGIVLNKFNIHVLSERLKTITHGIVENENKLLEDKPKLKDLPIGYFGASTIHCRSQTRWTSSYNYKISYQSLVNRFIESKAVSIFWLLGLRRINLP